MAKKRRKVAIYFPISVSSRLARNLKPAALAQPTRWALGAPCRAPEATRNVRVEDPGLGLDALGSPESVRVAESRCCLTLSQKLSSLALVIELGDPTLAPVVLEVG